MAYIGKSPTGSGVRQRYHFTATGGETSLSGADDNSKTLKFTDGEYVDVYLNGILLVQGTDYGVGTSNTISSLAALSSGDIVEVVVYDIFNVAKINSEAVRARHYFTATGGETSIGTSQIAGLSFAANADIDVSLNGISLVAGTDYNTTTANTVGGLSALTAGQVVEIVIYEKFQLADALSKSAGGNLGGALGVGTIKDATGTTTAMTIDSSGRVTMANTTQIDMWRLTANFGTNNATVTGWEQPDDTYSAVAGTSMSESSGVFTFPNTGLWRIGMAVQFSLTSGDTSAGVNLDISTNSGSSYDGSAASFESYGSSASGFNHALINVTDASSFRAKLTTSGINTGTVLVGSSTKNQTTLMFERITDAQ